VTKVRTVAFVLLGVAGLVLKPHYGGPLQELIWDHGGNVAASFAAYFVLALLPFAARWRGLPAAGLALLAAELFEATDGIFGLMGNVYDGSDYVANVVGVGLAWAVDTIVRAISGQGEAASESPGEDGRQ
jgi:hypothetical protein